MSTKIERALFKALTATLLDYEPNQGELSSLAKSLSDGRLSLALRDVVRAYSSLYGSEESHQIPDVTTKNAPKSNTKVDISKAKSTEISVDKVFDLAKRRKVTRAHLRNLMDQVDPQASARISDTDSMRDWLKSFSLSAHPEDWKLLRSLIAGEAASDPFLRDILG